MLLFDWDEANRAHIALHDVTPEEAEQVFRNDPFDVSYEVAAGEERLVQIGETYAGRVLLLITTTREERVRVVTCYKPSKLRITKYLHMRRSFHE